MLIYTELGNLIRIHTNDNFLIHYKSSKRLVSLCLYHIDSGCDFELMACNNDIPLRFIASKLIEAFEARKEKIIIYDLISQFDELDKRGALDDWIEMIQKNPGNPRIDPLIK